MKRALAVGMLVAMVVVACRTPSATQNAADAPEVAASSAASPIDAGSPVPITNTHEAGAALAGPPPVVDACTRDDECAVAQIEVAGPTACCQACGTTPGTRAWHAQLQLWCAEHATPDCPALACPQGPTRAICDAGHCRATTTGPDGGVTFVRNDQRCLPALVCSAWVGCALVRGNDQDGWFVASATSASVPKGSIASVVDDACTPRAPKKCRAAIVSPKGLVCPPTSIPPLVPVPKPCVLVGADCRPAP